MGQFQADRAIRLAVGLAIGYFLVDLAFFAYANLFSTDLAMLAYYRYDLGSSLIIIPLYGLAVWALWHRSRTFALLFLLLGAINFFTFASWQFGWLITWPSPWWLLPFPLTWLLLGFTLWAYYRATKATFQHRRQLKLNRERLSWRARTREFAGWVALAFLAPISFLLLLMPMTPAVIPMAILQGEEIPHTYEQTLRKEGVLNPDEELQFFYGSGIFSVTEGAILLTDERVVAYRPYPPDYYSYPTFLGSVRGWEFGEIQKAQLTSFSWLGGPNLQIETQRGRVFQLPLSSAGNRHLHLLQAIKKRITPRHSRSSLSP